MLFLLLTVMLLSSCASEQAHLDAPTKKDLGVQQLVAGYHLLPTKEQWRALGDEPAQRMMVAYSQFSEVSPWQAKILHGLRFFDGGDVQLFLKTKTEVGTKSILRREAVSSLVVLKGEAALNDLSALLDDSDAKLRSRVVDELVKLNSPKSRTLVKSHLDKETSPLVRRKATKALSREFRGKLAR
jgi:hypothetical protein